MIKNKHGAIAITGMLVLLVVAVLLTFGFLFSKTIMYSVLGIAIVGGAIYLIGTIKNDRLKIVFIGGLIVGGLILVFSSGLIRQSILSVDEIYVGNDGKVYWNFFASANKPGETYLFTYNPQEYTKSDGTEIQPSEGLVLTISPGKPECIYQATFVNKPFPQRDYYILNNPEKKIDVEIFDRNGKSTLLDGTTVSSATIKDTDGKGFVNIETQGLLSGKYNCPNYENVAIIIEDGVTKYYFKDKIQSSNEQNTQFLNSFESTPNFDGNRLIGEIQFGYPTFTITADQDYFNSAVYIPPKQANPRITDIDYNNEVLTGDSSSIRLSIKNLENSEGLISIEADAYLGSISPTSKNLEISPTTRTTSFTFKAPSSLMCGDIDFKVCSTDQFVSNNCDEDSIRICSVSDEPDEICGDNICQSWETFNTCPSDCDSNKVDDEEIVCAWYQEPYTRVEKDYGFAYWRAYTPFVEPITTETVDCKISDGIYLALGVILILIFGITAIMVSKPKRRKRKRR